MMNGWVTGGVIVAGLGIIQALIKILGARTERHKQVQDGDASMIRATTEWGKSMFDQLVDMRRRLDRMQERQDEHASVLVQHAEWDRKVVRAFRDLGEPLDDPPPLYPAPHAQDNHNRKEKR